MCTFSTWILKFINKRTQKKFCKLPLVKMLSTTPSQHLLQLHWHLLFSWTISEVASSKVFFPWMRESRDCAAQPIFARQYLPGGNFLHVSLKVGYPPLKQKPGILNATTAHVPIRKAWPPRERNVSAWIKVHFIARSCFILLQRLETEHRIKYFSKYTFCPQSTKMLPVFYRV